MGVKFGLCCEWPTQHKYVDHESQRLLREIRDNLAAGEPLDKQLAPQLRGVLEDAVKTMNNPPATWYQYLSAYKYKEIVRMETAELENALVSHESANDVRRELVHTIAALMRFIL